VKSLLWNACPTLTFFNKVYCGRADSGNNRKRISGDSESKCSAHVDNLALSQLVSGSIFASQVNKASAPLVFGVFGQSNPFEVFWPVVKLVTVDVIYGKFRLKSRNKGQSDQPMDKHFWPLVSKFCGNNMVASLVYPGLNLCLGPYAFKSLRVSESRPLSFSNCLWTKNSSIFGHKPVDAFFMDGYGVHAVNYTTGHR
jgi:hypothetical protein